MSDSVLERFRLDGKVALVTGGVRGLGMAMARALAQAGASVVVTSRNADTAKDAARALATDTGQACLGVLCDVTRAESIDAAIAEVQRELGAIDILVNSAGTTERGRIADLTVLQWDQVLDTNLRGVWLMTRAALPLLRERGGGCILNVASMFHVVALAERSPYIASKGGVASLTRALAIELAADRIRVNAICPGPFATDMAQAAARARMLEDIPLGRWGQPEELGPVAVFLCSDASSYMTGACVNVDGGYTAR